MSTGGHYVTTCASVVWFEMQWDPLGDGQVSSMYKHWDRAKGVSSMTALAHRFPPPLLSGCLFQPNGQDTDAWDLLSWSFISRLGNCSSGPQRLIYICTWEWLIESKSMLKKRWLNVVCMLSACCPCLSGDVRDGWVRDCSALPCVAVSWLSQVMVCCQVGMCMMQFHQIELWQSMTVPPY